jgi:hypothetical protein
MAAQPLIRMYEAYQDAAQTVQEMEAAGILCSDISIITSHFVDRGTNGMTPDRLELTAIGDRSKAGKRYAISPASTAGTGLISGLGALTIPDIGPVVAAGWLVSSADVIAAGLAQRGLVCALTDSGLNERRVRLYVNGVRGGATLVAVRSDCEHHALTQTILQRHNPIDPEVFDMAHRYHSFDELPSSGSSSGCLIGGELRANDAGCPSGVGIFRT